MRGNITAGSASGLRNRADSNIGIALQADSTTTILARKLGNDEDTEFKLLTVELRLVLARR